MKKECYTSYFDSEILPTIVSKYDEIKQWLIEEPLVQEFNQAEQELKDAQNKYKKEHNEFLYFLVCIGFIFSILLLCIPLYWNIKKYKQLSANKKALQDNISREESEKLEVHKKILKSICFDKFFKYLQEIINYTNKGPIPQKLVELMQESSLFTLQDDNHHNWYDTSWGVYDDKIVLNVAQQIHEEYLETYTGNKTIYYTYRDSDGNSHTASEVVYASFKYPAFRINDWRQTYSFMESCSNLEFHLKELSGSFSSKRFNKKNNYSPLENAKFEKRFNWLRTDDAQFRMIFTPLCQENFLNEYNVYDKIVDELCWSKTKAFITNQVTRTSDEILLEKCVSSSLQNFLINASLTLEQFKNRMFDDIKTYFHNLYRSMNYMWLTSIMTSENHKTIINAAEKNKNTLNNLNQNMFSHYSLIQHLNKKIITLDTDCFNKLLNQQTLNFNGVDLKLSLMEGLSYEKAPRVTYIPTSSSQGIVDVPVHYYEYIPHTKTGYVGNMYCPHDLFHYPVGNVCLNSNINNQELKNELDNLGSMCNYTIKNNILSFYIESLPHLPLDNKIAHIIGKICQIFYDQNSSLNSNKQH